MITLEDSTVLADFINYQLEKPMAFKIDSTGRPVYQSRNDFGPPKNLRSVPQLADGQYGPFKHRLGAIKASLQSCLKYGFMDLMRTGSESLEYSKSSIGEALGNLAVGGSCLLFACLWSGYFLYKKPSHETNPILPHRLTASSPPILTSFHLINRNGYAPSQLIQ